MIELKEMGYLDNLLISHDVATKNKTAAYGGPGVGHILREVVPGLKNSGFSDEDINTLLVENPKKILTLE